MSRKSKAMTIQELRAKQAEITRQLEQLEQAERAAIGKEVQRLTGLASWVDIADKWQIVPRDSTPNKVQETSDDEPFPIKDPFHMEAAK